MMDSGSVWIHPATTITFKNYGAIEKFHGKHGMTNSWYQRPVFVTGCTGLLGSWLAQELIERGAQVVGLVRDWTPQSRLFREGIDKRLTLVYGDVEDMPTLERALNEYEIQV